MSKCLVQMDIRRCLNPSPNNMAYIMQFIYIIDFGRL